MTLSAWLYLWCKDGFVSILALRGHAPRIETYGQPWTALIFPKIWLDGKTVKNQEKTSTLCKSSGFWEGPRERGINTRGIFKEYDHAFLLHNQWNLSLWYWLWWKHIRGNSPKLMVLLKDSVNFWIHKTSAHMIAMIWKCVLICMK